MNYRFKLATIFGNLQGKSYLQVGGQVNFPRHINCIKSLWRLLNYEDEVGELDLLKFADLLQTFKEILQQGSPKSFLNEKVFNG